MNKWFCSVAAMLVGAAWAEARPSGESWTTLDEEIDSLVTSQPVQGGGPELGVLLRVLAYMRDGYDDGDGGSTPDLSGFTIPDADLWVQGSLDQWSWRLSTDFDSGTATLEDGWASMNFTNEAALTFGMYKNQTLHSSRVDPEAQMFLDRSWIANGFDHWDTGAMVDVQSGQFAGYFSVQNGETGIQAIHSYMARLEVYLNGASNPNQKWFQRNTGRLANQTTMIGVFHYEDDVAADAQVNGIDFAASLNGWDISAEFIDVDKDAPTGWVASPDTTPWDIGGKYTMNQNFRVGARYQDADDDADTTGFTVGVDYIPGDPRAYWSLEVDLVDSDDDSRDGEAFRLGDRKSVV